MILLRLCVLINYLLWKQKNKKVFDKSISSSNTIIGEYIS